MESFAISTFKAKCLSILQRVKKTRKPIRITRFGKPIADIIPPTIPKRPGHWMGSLRGTIRIHGDIVSPAAGEDEWDALK